MASGNGDVPIGRGSSDPEGASINEIIASSQGSFRSSSFYGGGPYSNMGSSFASSLLAPASLNEPGDVSPPNTAARLARETPLLMGSYEQQQQQQQQMVPYSPSGVVSIDPPSERSSRRTGNEYTSGVSISSSSRDPPNSTERGFEHTAHQISATIGEIRAMETNDNSSVSRISTSMTTRSGSATENGSVSAATTTSWKRLIGPEYMKQLIELDQPIRDRVVGNIKMFADSTDDTELIGLFACDQIDSNREHFTDTGRSTTGIPTGITTGTGTGIGGATNVHPISAAGIPTGIDGTTIMPPTSATDIPTGINPNATETGLNERDRVLDKSTSRVLGSTTGDIGDIPGLRERTQNGDSSSDDGSTVESVTHLATTNTTGNPTGIPTGIPPSSHHPTGIPSIPVVSTGIPTGIPGTGISTASLGAMKPAPSASSASSASASSASADTQSKPMAKVVEDFIEALAQQQLNRKSTGFDEQWQMKKWDMEVIHKSNKATFPVIPKVLTDVDIGYWYEEVKQVLQGPPWNIDGTSILDMRTNLGSEPLNHSVEYNLRNSKLASHLFSHLRDSKLHSLIDEIKSLKIDSNDGGGILETIYDLILPRNAAQILTTLPDLANLRHENGETMANYHSRCARTFQRIKTMGYETLDELFVAYTQLGVLEGAYKNHSAVAFVREQLDHKHADLASHATPRDFTNHMNDVFVNTNVYSAGKMVSYNSAGTARYGGAGTGNPKPTAPAAEGLKSSKPDDGRFVYASGHQLCRELGTVFDVANVFKQTNCLACRVPKGGKDNHYMQNCDHLKEFGFEITYDPKKDKHRESVARNTLFKQRMKAKKEAEKNHPTTAVEAATTKKSSLKTDVDTSSDTIQVGTASRVIASASRVNGQGTVAGLGQFAAIADPDTSDDEDGGLVPATTVVNDVNNSESHDYIHSFSRRFLTELDYTDINGCIHHCASIASARVGRLSTLHARIASKSAARHGLVMVPDSGATAHMLISEEYFENNYRKCKNTFVVMGDGQRVPVVGYGTARIKINGKVCILKNALHIPLLDCNLFSTTRHGCNGTGCTFFLGDGKMHLTFPHFTIDQTIPADGDLKVTLEPMEKQDWHTQDFACDGKTTADRVTSAPDRINYLNRVYFGRAMTRAQKKNKLLELRSTLDKDQPCEQRDAQEDDRYIIDGNPEECVKQYLKGLTIEEIREFISDDAGTTAGESFAKAPRTPPPPYHIESSRGDTVDRVDRYTLQSYFGGRDLKDFHLLSKLGDGLSVVNSGNDDLECIGSLVNKKRGKRRRHGKRATVPLEVVGMDIGYGDDVSIGGFKYVLILIDQCTRNSFVYGMHGSSGADVSEALWKFFIDAGGFPRTLQCDFDNRIISGKAAALLRSHGVNIRAAPPYRQDKNGLVERRWQEITKMARTYLTEAKLPKKFWFWAIREANLRMNLLPVTCGKEGDQDPALLTTPHKEFYGEKPDYRILFPFGCVGSYRRVRDSNRNRTTFESQCMLGIALGRSEYTNGMIFYNPELDSFSTSADYVLDKKRSIGEVFPSIRYDGGLITSVISNKKDGPPRFTIGESIFIQCQETFDIIPGKIKTPPTTATQQYTVTLENGTDIDIDRKHIYDKDSVPASGKPSISLGFFNPGWMKQDQKITLLLNNRYRAGYLNLDKENYWEFVRRGRNGQVTQRESLRDLEYSWKMRLQENTMEIGWQQNIARRIYGFGRHVSAVHLQNAQAPGSLLAGLRSNDKEIWKAAYEEEYTGLSELDVFTTITEHDYQELVRIHGDDAVAIPTMNLFTVKNDKEGNPVRAKSRIVALGNLERRIWSREDRYAPVLNSISSRLLLSMAVEDGRRLKQGDCKNAFCNGILPDDEICVVKPPLGCPKSPKGTYWKLNKTLYGLARSAHHWYTKLSNHLIDDMGFRSMAQDKCVLKCTPFEGEPPIYCGIYVDDFIYYSTSDKVEQWFEQQLKSHVKVDFMGDVSWFLGQRYEWHDDVDGLSCHVSQQAFVEGMIDKHGLNDCTIAKTPFRSGLKIDRIAQDGIKPEDKPKLVHAYQSIMGGINWLCINSRPDVATAYKLLSQFNCNPSQGHLDAAKYVLKYLSATSSHGLWFKQHENRLEAAVSLPSGLTGNEFILWTDSNWGPQDASAPKENETRTVGIEELKSVQGFYITRMGGPLCWGVTREKRGSRSSCVAELKSMDEGIKGIQFLRHLMKQIGLPDVDTPTPILNDNRGSLDWIESGCRPTKKLRHENLAELGIEEAKLYNEVDFYWIPGKTNLADLFTKEDNDVKHYCEIRDHMVMPREQFGISFTNPNSRPIIHPRGVSNIDKDENENEEMIHTSLMNGKSLNDSGPQNARTEEEADFTLGGGGVYAPISCE